MPDINVNDILGGPNLCGIIQETKTGIPDVFPEPFYRKDQTVDGDTGSYKMFTGTRTNARMSAYGAPSNNNQLRNIQEKAVKLIHNNENIILSMKDYANLLEYDSLKKQQAGAAEVARQIREAKKRLDNHRVSALTSALFQGAIYYDALGNLLPTSSGAATTVDFLVPAGNKAQLNVFGAGNIINATWATTSTDIDKQIIALHQAAVRLTGYKLKYAFYGKNIPSLLTANTKLGNYFQRNQSFNPQYIQTADIPNPLLDLTWQKAYWSFFEDSAGAIQSLVDDDTIVFTPEPDEGWIGTLEGTYPVPRCFDFSENATKKFDFVPGMFSYGVPLVDPATAKIVYGDTHLPVIKNPKAIFIAKVVF